MAPRRTWKQLGANFAKPRTRSSNGWNVGHSYHVINDKTNNVACGWHLWYYLSWHFAFTMFCCVIFRHLSHSSFQRRILLAVPGARMHVICAEHLIIMNWHLMQHAPHINVCLLWTTQAFCSTRGPRLQIPFRFPNKQSCASCNLSSHLLLQLNRVHCSYIHDYHKITGWEFHSAKSLSTEHTVLAMIHVYLDQTWVFTFDGGGISGLNIASA